MEDGKRETKTIVYSSERKLRVAKGCKHFRAWRLLGKSSWLRLIPVVRKETKGTQKATETRGRGTYNMKTSSEMIKLRTFRAYVGIKEGLREMECAGLYDVEVRGPVSSVHGQYRQIMASF